MPSALFALYQDLASIRDHVVSRDDPMRPFRGKPVEVFIKAVSASGPRGLRAGNYEMGDCPYSQRVLIAMEELGIPHRIVPIDTHHKPGWFHLMSGESLVPVIFTDGTLVSGSRHIMSYLIDKYPRRAQGALGPSCVGGLRVGTMAYAPGCARGCDSFAGRVEGAQRDHDGHPSEAGSRRRAARREDVFAGGHVDRPAASRLGRCRPRPERGVRYPRRV
jgi:glutaredoxin